MRDEAAHMAQWTPVSVTVGAQGMAIDWGDMRGTRFAEPFFHQTVERWAGGDPPPLIRTGLDALHALDGAPSLDPDALIFHVSRCGSTLLSRLLGSVPGVLAVSEPGPLNGLLLADPGMLGGASKAAMLRLMVRALGRRRFGDERHYVVKLSSWNATHTALFRRAFPAARLIWLMRAPEAVVASLVADPPGWLALRYDRAAARQAFGIEEPAAEADRFSVQAVAALLNAASEFADSALLLDYTELPEAVWERVAPALGIALEPADIARMQELARFEAKDAALRPFAAKPERAKPLAPAARALVAQWASPLHDRLISATGRSGARDLGTARRL
jgi:hypothetical protein